MGGEWTTGSSVRAISATSCSPNTADTILGQVIDRMKDEGIYDEALLVVLADHGITIRPGIEHERIMTPETVGTIAAVPLFVKYPNRFRDIEPGTIDDIRAETTDILPTIADVVGITVPWDMDGSLPARFRKGRHALNR